MASVTQTIRTVVSNYTLNDTYANEREKIEKARPKLFDFDYPIFDAEYKKTFETHFIRNFYMREIGFETEGLFKFHLETWLNIHMPYYNKLFQSELLEYDPLSNSKMSVTHTKTTDTDKTDTRNSSGNIDTSVNATSTDDNFQRQIQADTADDQLSLTTNDGQGVIEYASSIEEDTQNNSNTTNGTTNTDTTSNDTITSDGTETESFNQTREGKIGVQSYAEMLVKHRNALIRIEKQMFDEMNKLFLLVYS